jgi:hypothetical protein
LQQTEKRSLVVAFLDLFAENVNGGAPPGFASRCPTFRRSAGVLVGLGPAEGPVTLSPERILGKRVEKLDQ